MEFAICAPFLLILFLGTIEILMLFRTEAKLNMFAGNFAQMVSLQENASIQTSGLAQAHSPVPAATLTDLCAGAVYGLQPFPPNGLTVNVASVTQVTASTYDEWEADLGNNNTGTPCAALGTEIITSAGAKALAIGNLTSTSMVQTIGDNVIIVKATLQYPGVLGLILTSAQTLGQTAIARWRYASPTNIVNVNNTTAPSSTLELSCSGTCQSHYGI